MKVIASSVPLTKLGQIIALLVRAMRARVSEDCNLGSIDKNPHMPMTMLSISYLMDVEFPFSGRLKLGAALICLIEMFRSKVIGGGS